METVQELVYAGGGPAFFYDRVTAGAPVREVRHELDLGRAGRAPLRLGFVSDLHIGPLTSTLLLENAFAALAAFRPDVLVMGGDYVSLEVTAAKADRLA